MRKDKKQTAESVEKPAVKTEQSAVLLNRAFRQKAFRMPE